MCIGQRFNRILYFIVAIVQLLFIDSALSAQVSLIKDTWNHEEILISGTIEKGDLVKVKQYAAIAISNLNDSSGEFVINIDSSGGDLRESMLIGRFARNLLARIEVYGNIIVSTESNLGMKLLASKNPSQEWGNLAIPRNQQLEPHHLVKAYSAGVIIFYGGVERAIRDNFDARKGAEYEGVSIPVIGIHRPYYDKQYFAKLSPVEADKQYRLLENEVRAYLSEMGAPQSLIDRMFNTSSTRIELIPDDEFRNMFRVKESFAQEWLIAKCGASSEDGVSVAEQVLTGKELNYYKALQAKMDKRLVDRVSKGLPFERYTFSSEYDERLTAKVRRYGRNIRLCKSAAIRNHQEEWARKYLSSK